MKFMEPIVTQEGEGVVVARGPEGEAVVSIRREALRGRVIFGPCVILMMRRCGRCGEWYQMSCIKCQAPSE